ncbi:uncharacterized protein PHACADRAFT_248069 [Phanerochaete carnosa HHB-10118-sp]|uniref:Methyltransferase domain-containing protein n=1 Tax=Phanerochaete carnosa (strain HHB-10118-sp) TaxID=650164 RepID=K5WPQ9_PHACS|nr:uncharacterized protein PHACADRAFT_248069 [Phanerochaete carnosa HHB-10118-sp]EKM61450.1 hypothetical protein PHACADRAFT_248069 [Phanerochaete carnosa HHB-10118-sp]
MSVSAHASSITSVEMASVRSASPSVISINSCIRASVFRHEYGRRLNNYSEVYRLPADEDEQERLDRQHHMFIEVMGKYAPPLPEVLAHEPGVPKSVVDLGSGSGSWILDVARDFPHVQAVAVDLIPLQVTCVDGPCPSRMHGYQHPSCRHMPPNCRSEIDDINLGLQHYTGEFDVSHVRLISSGIRDYDGLIDQIALTLKPGGLVDLTEFDFRVYGADRRPAPLEDEGGVGASALARWMHLAHRAVQMQGGEPDAANHLYRWVSARACFRDVCYREWWIQTTTWNTGTDACAAAANRHGASMRDDILAFLLSGRPLLLGTGVPEQILDPLEEAARQELLEGRVPGYIRVEQVYARKR